ncbi:MAG: hypothetical protein WEB57_03280 [Pseudohongiellaceae bacterium]
MAQIQKYPATWRILHWVMALAGRLFAIHGALVITLCVLVIGHIVAAFRHMLRKDGIFRRMV